MRVVLPLTLRRCRDAARAVHHTEDGPAAVRRLRGERMGFYRSRPVLALLLYLAAAQGRLVWRSPREFAVLEPPVADHGWAGPGWHAWWAKRVEGAWQFLRIVSPMFPLLAALPLALLAGRSVRLLWRQLNEIGCAARGPGGVRPGHGTCHRFDEVRSCLISAILVEVAELLLYLYI